MLLARGAVLEFASADLHTILQARRLNLLFAPQPEHSPTKLSHNTPHHYCPQTPRCLLRDYPMHSLSTVWLPRFKLNSDRIPNCQSLGAFFPSFSLGSAPSGLCYSFLCWRRKRRRPQRHLAPVAPSLELHNGRSNKILTRPMISFLGGYRHLLLGLYLRHVLSLQFVFVKPQWRATRSYTPFHIYLIMLLSLLVLGS